MKDTTTPGLSIEACMDILDWFNDEYLDYLNHIMLAKLDGEKRIERALPSIREHCLKLVNAHRDTESAYPMMV